MYVVPDLFPQRLRTEQGDERLRLHARCILKSKLVSSSRMRVHRVDAQLFAHSCPGHAVLHTQVATCRLSRSPEKQWRAQRSTFKPRDAFVRLPWITDEA